MTQFIINLSFNLFDNSDTLKGMCFFGSLLSAAVCMIDMEFWRRPLLGFSVYICRHLTKGINFRLRNAFRMSFVIDRLHTKISMFAQKMILVGKGFERWRASHHYNYHDVMMNTKAAIEASAERYVCLRCIKFVIRIYEHWACWFQHRKHFSPFVGFFFVRFLRG